MKNDLKSKVDRLAMEVNIMAQFVDSSGSGNVKLCLSHFRRVSDKCLITHYAPYVLKQDILYLDNGCSYHMTSDKKAFLSLTPAYGNMIEFGGDA